MTRRPPPMPTVPTKRLLRQRAIVRKLVAESLLAYAVFGAALVVLARPAFQAFQHGSLLGGALVAVGLALIYAILGGALCVSFASRLQKWPPPGAPCELRGGHFVRTWLWSAPRVLVELGLHGHIVHVR